MGRGRLWDVGRGVWAVAPPDARILDIGCAKGFLLHDFKLQYPECETWGLDISVYAASQAPALLKNTVVVGNAKDLPFEEKYFDLVISINSLLSVVIIPVSSQS